MRTKILATLALCLLPAIALAGAAPGALDRRAFAEDQRVATHLKAMADARVFDEVGARRLMPLMLLDGLGPEEQDLFFELAAARTPVTIRSPFGPEFTLVPPNGAAREYLNLFKVIAESTNLQETLDQRWLAGPRPMKELVDVSTFGTQLDNSMAIYLSRKLAASWSDSNADNEYAPIKEDIAKYVAQVSQTDADTERRGKQILYNAARNLDRDLNDAIPDDIYMALR